MAARPRLRLCALAIAVALAFAAVSALAPHSPAAIRESVAGLGIAAPLILIAAWGVLTPALFPGTVLAAGGGLLLGAAPGVVVSLAGATLGAGAAFAIARLAGPRGRVPDAAARLGSLQIRLERRPVMAVALLRVAPGVPASLLNYAIGLSRVRARHFLLGITIGGAPRVAVYALLGAHLADPRWSDALPFVGALALVTAASAAVAWRVRRGTRPAGTG
jgi:uncharacterized membrane protein YdjX (TVP38/TMEM64 family)